MRIVSLFCLLIVVLSSCDPGVEISNPTADKLLYINGKFSPRDSSLKVTVMRAAGLSERLSDDEQMAKDARVTISDGTREATLRYNSYWQRFEGLNIFQDAKAGTKFTLVATTPDGARAVAQSILPPKPKIISFYCTLENNRLKYRLVWDNVEGHRYFQAWYSLQGVAEDLQGKPWPINYMENLPLEPQVFFWDQQPTGRNSLNDSTTLIYQLKGRSTVSFTLANMEDKTWKYEKTYSKYQSWLSNAQEPSIIPVFREPIDVYNNIEGGFGIFASFNCTDSLKVVVNT